MFKTISLPVAIEELTVVSNSFHTKPLRRYLQSVERYNVLGLSLHDYQIYEGNRHSLIELKLPPDTPENINDALGYDLTDKHHRCVLWWCRKSNRRHASRSWWET
jgi:hypothetical protein